VPNLKLALAGAASRWGKTLPWIMGTASAEKESIREFSFRSIQFSVTPEQVVRRTVVFELGCCLALKFGNDSLGEHFTQLDAPLVKRISVQIAPCVKTLCS
jgi:hypothetical protein